MEIAKHDAMHFILWAAIAAGLKPQDLINMGYKWSDELEGKL